MTVLPDHRLDCSNDPRVMSPPAQPARVALVQLETLRDYERDDIPRIRSAVDKTPSQRSFDFSKVADADLVLLLEANTFFWAASESSTKSHCPGSVTRCGSVP
jgi:hypothetical protein